MPGVIGAASADWFGARYQNESNAFPVFAVDPKRYLDMYPEFDIPPEQREAFARTRTARLPRRPSAPGCWTRPSGARTSWSADCSARWTPNMTP